MADTDFHNMLHAAGAADIANNVYGTDVKSSHFPEEGYGNDSYAAKSSNPVIKAPPGTDPDSISFSPTPKGDGFIIHFKSQDGEKDLDVKVTGKDDLVPKIVSADGKPLTASMEQEGREPVTIEQFVEARGKKSAPVMEGGQQQGQEGGQRSAGPEGGQQKGQEGKAQIHMDSGDHSVPTSSPPTPSARGAAPSAVRGQ